MYMCTINVGQWVSVCVCVCVFPDGRALRDGGGELLHAVLPLDRALDEVAQGVAFGQAHAYALQRGQQGERSFQRGLLRAPAQRAQPGQPAHGARGLLRRGHAAGVVEVVAQNDTQSHTHSLTAQSHTHASSHMHAHTNTHTQTHTVLCLQTQTYIHRHTGKQGDYKRVGNV